MTRSPLPNALIIGVQKSSTSWLAARLQQHPDVFVAPGELHYFDRETNYRRGSDWYRSRFAGSESAKIRLEKTGAYFWTTCQDVPEEPDDKPERIASLVPDAKLIVLLRDPVSRAYSAWNHLVRAGHVRARGSSPDLFDDEIAGDVVKHGVLSRGLYHAQLSRYLKVFDPEQILVLFQERDVIEAPKAGMARVCRFLDLDSSISFDALDRVENRFGGTLLGNRLTVGAPGPLRQVLHRIDRYVLCRLPIKHLPYPEDNARTREKLADYFEDDCRRLAELVGPLPDNWLGGRFAV